MHRHHATSTCSASSACCGRRAASTFATTSCRRSSADCSAAWSCTRSRASTTTSISAGARHRGPGAPSRSPIHVTRFFREPESFQALTEQILPEIIAHQAGDNPIRVWVAGCSSGEEAYSVAIALLEALGDRANTVPIQIFATDVSEQAIEQARNGSYPENIAADVSPERLRRFFTKVDGGYRIIKLVRDLCIFARQNLRERSTVLEARPRGLPERAHLHERGAAERLLTVFHYALKPNGYVMLGHAENRRKPSELFAIEDKRHRIYKKKISDAALPTMSFHADRFSAPPTVPRKHLEPGGSSSIQHEADRIALDRYAPPGVLVDGEVQIVQFRGQTGVFLEPAPGDPSMSLLKMAREGLLHGVRTAFHAARKSGKSRSAATVEGQAKRRWRDVGGEVVPLARASQPFPVLFRPAGSAGQRRRGGAAAAPVAGQARDARGVRT